MSASIFGNGLSYSKFQISRFKFRLPRDYFVVVTENLRDIKKHFAKPIMFTVLGTRLLYSQNSRNFKRGFPNGGRGKVGFNFSFLALGNNPFIIPFHFKSFRCFYRIAFIYTFLFITTSRSLLLFQTDVLNSI